MAKRLDFVGETKGNEAQTVAVPVEKLGPPGLSHTLIVVDVVDGKETNATGPRPFRVWGVLVTQELLFSPGIHVGPQDGDTLVDFRCGGFHIEGGPREHPIKMEFFSNAQGRLGRVESTIQTESWSQAERVFRSAVTHLLSIWSWHHSVPLALTAVGGADPTGGRTYQSYVPPLPVVTTAPQIGKGFSGGPSFLAAASYYREGIGSPNVPYRLLCFYKLFLTLDRVRRGFEKRAIRAGLVDHAGFNQAVDVRVERTTCALRNGPTRWGGRFVASPARRFAAFAIAWAMSCSTTRRALTTSTTSTIPKGGMRRDPLPMPSCPSFVAMPRGLTIFTGRFSDRTMRRGRRAVRRRRGPASLFLTSAQG